MYIYIPTLQNLYILCLCVIVHCQNLTRPNNGMINCSLGDDEVPSYEDTCSFTCNTGYELIGNDTTFCQSDGSWSGSNTLCKGGLCCSYRLSRYI